MDCKYNIANSINESVFHSFSFVLILRGFTNHVCVCVCVCVCMCKTVYHLVSANYKIYIQSLLVLSLSLKTIPMMSL